MRSFGTSGWTVTHVHVDDWSTPSDSRPARVLLHRERSPGHVLPIKADRHQLFGALLLDVSLETWRPLNPRSVWEPGRIPILADGRISFIEPSVLERRRTMQADRLIGEALAGDTPLEDAEGLLELADALLGGDVVPLAAKMYLLRTDASRRERLRTRFLRAAPTGAATLEIRLREFDTFRDRSELKDAVRAAVLEGLREPIEAEAWSRMRDETLANWWIRWTIFRPGGSLRGVAERLGVEVPRLRALLYRSTGLATLAGLPPREKMLADLNDIRSDLSEETAAALADAHGPRLALFAQQMAALERLTGRSDRLDRWAAAASPIAEARDWARRLNDAPPWQRAQLSSEKVRYDLLGIDTQSPAPIRVCIEQFGATVAHAALASPNLLCASSIARETGPVIALPRGLDAGAARFAIAHQIGHLLDPDSDGALACARTRLDVEAVDSIRESFANAFALYLLAPRSAVQAQVRGVSLDNPPALFDATADVATVFGLSAGAALRHVLNCAGVDDFDRALGRALHHSEWRRRREAIDDETAGAWHESEDFAAGPVQAPAWGVETALCRPVSAHFDQLLLRAGSARLLDQAEVDALLAA